MKITWWKTFTGRIRGLLCVSVNSLIVLDSSMSVLKVLWVYRTVRAAHRLVTAGHPEFGGQHWRLNPKYFRPYCSSLCCCNCAIAYAIVTSYFAFQFLYSITLKHNFRDCYLIILKNQPPYLITYQWNICYIAKRKIMQQSNSSISIRVVILYWEIVISHSSIIVQYICTYCTSICTCT